MASNPPEAGRRSGLPAGSARGSMALRRPPPGLAAARRPREQGLRADGERSRRPRPGRGRRRLARRVCAAPSPGRSAGRRARRCDRRLARHVRYWAVAAPGGARSLSRSPVSGVTRLPSLSLRPALRRASAAARAVGLEAARGEDDRLGLSRRLALFFFFRPRADAVRPRRRRGPARGPWLTPSDLDARLPAAAVCCSISPFRALPLRVGRPAAAAGGCSRRAVTAGSARRRRVRPGAPGCSWA